MPDDPRAVVRQFINCRFPEADISDDEDIFALGFVNSLFAMELVMFVEKQFSVTIPNEELTRDNFRTVAALTRLVERLGAVVSGR